MRGWNFKMNFLRQKPKILQKRTYSLLLRFVAWKCKLSRETWPHRNSQSIAVHGGNFAFFVYGTWTSFVSTDLEVWSLETVKELSYCCLLIINGRAVMFDTFWPGKSFSPKLARKLKSDRVDLALARRRKFTPGWMLRKHENCPKGQLEIRGIMK